MADWSRFGIWMLCLGACVGFWVGVVFTVIEVAR